MCMRTSVVKLVENRPLYLVEICTAHCNFFSWGFCGSHLRQARCFDPNHQYVCKRSIETLQLSVALDINTNPLQTWLRWDHDLTSYDNMIITHDLV